MHCKVSNKGKLTYVVECPCKPSLIYQVRAAGVGLGGGVVALITHLANTMEMQ